MARAQILGARAARPLEGRWEITALRPGLATTPEELERLGPVWLACARAEPAAAALRSIAAWNLKQRRDFDGEDWWYRCRFDCASPGEPTRIRFDGLATIADIWLNGTHILHSESMFIAHDADVTRLLRAENELFLRFHALAPLLAAKRPRPAWRSAMVAHQALRWYRTSLLGRMPSWCPPVAPVGPWRPILIETSPLRIDSSTVHATIDDAGGTAGRVRVSFRATHPAGASVNGHLTVGGSEVPLECETQSDTQCVLAATAQVPRPDRWWPHTHGTQPLYPVRASITAGVTETIDLGRVGFRTIEVDRDVDGRGFGLIVNGASLFCRGVCWTPLDLAALCADPATYRNALEQLRRAGMNMVRIGGTFAYETEQFHDLCDELGIMVWQDFMFANMDYPWRDAAFASLASQEATQTLGVLQSRPSLVVLCGNSEVDQQAAMLGLQDWQESVDSDAMLGDLVRTMTPGEVWLPTTPTGGTLPFQVDSGVSHYYGVGAYRRPFDDARRAGVRFAAECLAFSNVPEDENIDAFLHDGESPGSHPRWKEGVPRDAAAGWDFEDVRDHYVERLFGVRPDELRARDPARYLALGRVATGEAMLRTFAEWRRPGSTCRGGLVWFSRDLRPGAGWGVIDAEDRPKPCYWYLKRALAPVALLSADEGLNGLWLHAVNDSTEPLDAVLRVTLYRNGLRCGVPALTTLSVPARGHETVHADALFDRFLDLTYAYRFGPPAHDVVVTTLRDRKSGKFLATATYWPGLLGADVASDVGLTVRTEPANDGCALVLETKRFAHAIAIDLDGYIPDDNYFDLEPRDVRTISLRLAGGDRAARGSVSALNSPRDVPIALTETVDAG